MKNQTFLLLQARLLRIYQKLHWWIPKQEGELRFVRKYAKSLRFLYETILKKIEFRKVKMDYIELTTRNNEPLFANIHNIDYVIKEKKGTIIVFSSGKTIPVNETAEVILEKIENLIQ